MFLRLFLILLLVFWFVPWLTRSMSRRRPPSAGAGAGQPEPDRDDRLANLTRQDISDADYEELPPEK
jgi:hypothetical protein